MSSIIYRKKLKEKQKINTPWKSNARRNYSQQTLILSAIDLQIRFTLIPLWQCTWCTTNCRHDFSGISDSLIKKYFE